MSDHDLRRGFGAMMRPGALASGLDREELQHLLTGVFDALGDGRGFDQLASRRSQGGRIQLARHVQARQHCQSVSGMAIKKGEPVVHLFSSNASGGCAPRSESFYLTQEDLRALLASVALPWSSKTVAARKAADATHIQAMLEFHAPFFVAEQEPVEGEDE